MSEPKGKDERMTVTRLCLNPIFFFNYPHQYSRSSFLCRLLSPLLHVCAYGILYKSSSFPPTAILLE